jgi:hypothetical protein
VCRRQGRVGAVGHPAVRGAVFSIWPGRTSGCCYQAAGNPGKGLGGQASCSRESGTISSPSCATACPHSWRAGQAAHSLIRPSTASGEQKKTENTPVE